MADVEQAIDFVLHQEDSTLSGVITDDTGGKTRYGIAERFHPELANCLFYSSMGSAAAQKVAESIYARQYCEPLCIAQIGSQQIANKLLSLGVNCGVVTAAKMLQHALDVPGLVADGRIGPITLDALDRAQEAVVLNRLCGLAADHYDDLIRRHPALGVYRAGWLRRAEA